MARRIHDAPRAALRTPMVLALGALIASCSLIVPDAVPQYHCTGTNTAACPRGMVCDQATKLCVVPDPEEDAGDEEEDAADQPEVDASDDGAPPGPASIGEACVIDRDCDKGLLCGTRTILTTAIVASDASPICTKPCCTSADCPASFVCFGAGTGGNYCVQAKTAGRSPTGTKKPGQTCSKGDACRSGLCSGGRCLDTCCADTDCAIGTRCRVKAVDVPSPSRETWACAPPEANGTIDSGASCSGASAKCENDNCSGFPLKCRPSCCNSKACGPQGSSVCAYGKFTGSGSDAKWCFDGNTMATAELGEACSGDPDCASFLCDLETKKCASACCTDADCPTDMACLPSPVGAPLLRCTLAR